MGVLLRIANGRCLPPLSVIWSRGAIESNLPQCAAMWSLSSGSSAHMWEENHLVVNHQFMQAVDMCVLYSIICVKVMSAKAA